MSRPNYLRRNILKNPCPTCHSPAGVTCDREIHPELLSNNLLGLHRLRIWNRPITEVRNIGLPNEGKNRGESND